MPSKIRMVFLSAALLAGLGTMPAAAAPANQPELTVTPFLQNIQLGSETTKSFEVIFTNDSNQARQLELSVADFGSLDQSGGVAFVGSEFGQLLDKYTLSPWLSLSANNLTIAAHQKGSVTATVTNSPAMGPGGHYAAIVATVLTPDGTSQNQVNLKQKISSLVFATKTGGEKYDLNLRKIESDAGLFHLPTEAYLTVRATGNTHVAPRGVVYLKNKAGRVVARGVINQESGYVLPDTSRIFTVKLNRLKSANFWNTSYYLQVDYRYDGLSVYTSKQTNLRYLSPLLVLLVLLVIAAPVVIARRLTKPKNKPPAAVKKLR